MKIFKGLVMLVSILISFTLKAQDVIVKTNKEEIKANVLEVGESEIKYKKFDHLDGPTYNVKKDEVFMILYKNGKRETFESSTPEVKRATQAGSGKTTLEKALDSSSSEDSENLAFNKGTKFLQLGLGVGGAYMSAGAESSMPAIQARYEFSVSNKMSAGAVLGYSSADLGGMTYSYLLAGARGNYHFLTSEKFDPYVGATLGYNKVSVDSENEFTAGAAASAVIIGAQVGANYYFSKGFGAWADLGYGLGYLNLGIVFKF